MACFNVEHKKDNLIPTTFIPLHPTLMSAICFTFPEKKSKMVEEIRVSYKRRNLALPVICVVVCQAGWRESKVLAKYDNPEGFLLITAMLV